MSVRRHAAGTLAALGLCSVVLAAATPAVAAISPVPVKIKPHQIFSASINGSNGLSTPVLIKMVCLGPIRVGETGHPLSGQKIAVSSAPVISTMSGNTGSAGRSITAFFGPPPPTPVSPVSPVPPVSTNQVRFTTYISKALPASLVLPCSGSGTVTFLPLPMSPTERSVGVRVVYGNITATQ